MERYGLMMKRRKGRDLRVGRPRMIDGFDKGLIVDTDADSDAGVMMLMMVPAMVMLTEARPCCRVPPIDCTAPTPNLFTEFPPYRTPLGIRRIRSLPPDGTGVGDHDLWRGWECGGNADGEAAEVLMTGRERMWRD